jgi:hypothetical protein
MPMTAKQRADCLAYDPFNGDFGDSNDRTMGDRIVRFRRPHWCHGCALRIAPGAEGRLTDKFWWDDHAVRSYRWCLDCCLAQARSWEDAGLALDAREMVRLRATKDPILTV